jgi:hypothetical protein
MPPKETAAMWLDANVNYTAQRKISQHCYEYFKRWIFAPEKAVRGFGDTAMKPTIGVHTTDDGKNIFYWWKPPDELLQHEINSLLTSQEMLDQLEMVQFSTGGDHGKGRFRHLLTVALRLRGGASIVERYCIGEIDSAKDTTQILENTFFSDLNTRLHRLATSELIITKDNQGKYGVQFPTAPPTTVATTSTTAATATASSSIVVVTRVPSKIFLCGDAKFYMQVLGRENAAPKWCVWCNINVCQFNFADYPDTALWTHETMVTHRAKGYTGADQLGVHSAPLFDFCPIDNVLPNVLHEKINTGNDLIGSIRSFTDACIEMITTEESQAQTALLLAEIAVEEYKEEIEQYAFAIRAMNIAIGDVQAIEEERSLTEDEKEALDEHVTEAVSLEREYDELVGRKLPHAKKKAAEKKKAFTTLWKQKRPMDFQVWNHIDNNIFQKYKMRTQAYHGGYKFSGVDVEKFVGNVDEIVGEIETFLIGLKPDAGEEISTFLGHVKRAAKMLDLMFAIL